MIKTVSIGFISIGDKKLLVKDFTLDCEPVPIDPSDAVRGHSPLTDLSRNTIDSTATVIDENVKALPSPDEVK